MKKIRRFINKTTLRSFIYDPGRLQYAFKHQISNGQIRPTESLFRKNFLHIANITAGNAGDTLLTVVLRDLFDRLLGCSMWKTKHVHDNIRNHDIKKISKKDLVVLGGGGLFLQDTNKNNISGWQWPISLSQLSKINNLVVFAVGYNRFRRQSEFTSNFRSSLELLVEKSKFFGIRNTGSMEALKEYLPKELHNKILFQPCMTTVLSNIYNFVPQKNDTIVIGLNCAFDRQSLRFGEKIGEILSDISKAFNRLSREYRIQYLAHSPSDEAMCKYLDHHDVKYELVKLYNKPPEYIISSYRGLSLVIGMRGHAQMIPFGCGVPIISLISHEKLKWFLQDIEAEEWGIDIENENLCDEIYAKANTILDDVSTVYKQVEVKRLSLWHQTQVNLNTIHKLLDKTK